MPTGVLIIHWDDKRGAELHAAVPQGVPTTAGLLQQIYSAHRYASLEAGYAALTFQDMRIISFFSGLKGVIIGEPNYAVAMLLRKDEPVAKFKELLLAESKAILTNMHSPKEKELLDALFDKMKRV
ncbi:MAG: hypothetical protein JW839_00925 [Candidatus Lokiarchaeota archaeon]|nr:hypothetical protein [Candidatus Lokiarchaeota archaeon]